jgi:5'-phosphate synthase pdxT subunit
MKIAVIAIQGNVEEHIQATERAMQKQDIKGEVIPVKHSGTIPECDGIVLPGGESTTLCRLMKKEGIDIEIKTAAAEHKPILATCAGLITLAKSGGEQAEKTGQQLLGIMDIEVDRNAFGRQRESFEAPLNISFLDTPYPAVFIRAPKITRAGEKVEITATFEGDIVGVKQNNIIGLSFHPELTHDTRIHQYFLKLTQQNKQNKSR